MLGLCWVGWDEDGRIHSGGFLFLPLLCATLAGVALFIHAVYVVNF